MIPFATNLQRLKRLGYKMEQEILHKVQCIELEIAKEVKRICDENDIKYFLDGGTLLGAVRHKGFIPWDDDFDIGMLREDYEKFLEIAPKVMDHKFFLQTPYTDTKHGLFFSKVRKLGTALIEKGGAKKQIHKEIWIDIFPYDSFPDEEKNQNHLKRKITLYRRLFYVKSNLRPWLEKKSFTKIVLCFLGYIPYKFISFFIKRNRLLAAAKQYQTKYNNCYTKFKYSQGSSRCGKWLISTKSFLNFSSLAFEDTQFSVLNDYDSFLKAGYGNYMQLPPKELRENQHNIIEVKT